VQSCFQHVVVPLDGSRLAERAVPDALTLARAGGGHVTLVQAVDRWRPFSDGAGSSLTTRELQAAGEYVSAVRERYWWVGVPIAVTVRLGPPGQVIRWVVQETAADLVVMATHGRAGLRREQLGSVALDVLHGEVPLLLRSPSAERQWDALRPVQFDGAANRVIAG
jgi:nucleotide-binding universal stress UspA family protein